jgi:hypothetical protein
MVSGRMGTAEDRLAATVTDDRGICERVPESIHASACTEMAPMRESTATRSWRLRTAGIGLAAAFLWATDVTTVRGVELVDHGPTVAFGYARERGEDLYFPALGWRWRYAFCERVDRAMASVGTELTWYVEPLVAATFGDQDAGEVQVVPGLRFESARPWLGGATPYLEGGIGLMYTGLDDIGLGSNILFSDNVGIGVTLAEVGWSFGYRYRHSSHAGLWAESNAGLDVHYLTLRYDVPIRGSDTR